MKIGNGDVFDIGQTVNGISKFVFLNNNWFYYDKKLFDKYQYDQLELTTSIQNNIDGEIFYLGNIFDNQIFDKSIDKTIESISNARDIIESFDETGAMTIGFDDDKYEISSSDLATIAGALYLSDCVIGKNDF